MAGREVTRAVLDGRIAACVIAMRDSLAQANTINDFLALNPSNAPEGDLLTKSADDGGFGYTSDEAYAIRLLFEGVANLNLAQLHELGKQFTGLD